jgi:hypothetical protein
MASTQQQKASKLLMFLVCLTQNLNNDRSYAKARTLTRLANYWQLIGEQQSTRQLLT